MQRSPPDPALPGGEAAASAVAGATNTSTDVPVSATAAPTTAAPTTAAPATAPVTNEKKEKRFHNGWNKSLEVLVAEWADKANCYRWMHDKAGLMFSSSNF